MIPNFVEMVLKYKPPPDMIKAQLKKPISVELVMELQSLFSKLTLSDRKYLSPEKVLKNVIDDFGNKVMIGEQKDAGEFNLNFLSRISECLCNEEESEITLEASLSLTKSYSVNIKPEKVEANNLMKLFFGKFDTTISLKDKEIELKNNVFGHISLRPSEATLYSSWISNYFNQSIENYKLDSGETVSALQNFWITQLPSVLFFQEQRVTYNKEKKELEKIKTPLHFEKEIYADLFLKQNRAKAEPLINDYFRIQKEIKEYETYISKWESSTCNDSIDSILSKVLALLNAQKADEKMADSGLQLYSPENLSAYIQIEPAKQMEIVTFFQKYRQIANEKVAIMKAKLQELKEMRDSIFKKYQENKYSLHSIIIHDGGATSGHYYAYIYDFENSKWWRFSDGFVKTEKEEVIFKEAIGGFNNCTAYYLIYINAKDIVPPKDSKMYKSYATMEEENKEMFDASYRNWVPLKEKMDILKDNQALHKEVENFKLTEIVRTVDSSYVMKYNQLQGIKKDKKFEAFYGTINFTFYLCKKFDNLPKWWLMKEVVMECCQINLMSINKKEQIYLKLDELRKQKEIIYPRSLELNEFDKKEIAKHTSEYTSYMENHTIANHGIECVLGKSLEDALNAFAILYQESTPKYEYYQKVAQLVNLIHLMLLTCISKNVEQAKLEDAYNNIMLLSMGLSTFYKSSDKYYLFIFKRIQYLIGKHQDKLISIQERISDTLQQLTLQTGLLKFSCRLPSNVEEEISSKKKGDKLYMWAEGWKEEGFTHKYMDNMTKCFKQLDLWNNWANKISIGTLTMDEMNEEELKIQTL